MTLSGRRAVLGRSLRTDKVCGAITCLFGIVMICFASFALLIVALQRQMLAAMPPFPQHPGRPSVADMIHAIHGVWFIYLPMMIVGGIIYAVAGFYIRSGSLAARRVAQANAIGGYLWVIAYSLSCYGIMDIVGPPDILPERAGTVIQWVSLIAGVLIGAAFPTGLLYILNIPPHIIGETERN